MRIYIIINFVFKSKDMLLLLKKTYHLNMRGHQKAYIAYSSDALNQFSIAMNRDMLQALKKKIPVAIEKIFNNRQKTRQCDDKLWVT